MQAQAGYSRNLILLGALALIVFTVVARIMPHAWNFTPAVAVAVFAAYAFRSGTLAWIVPLSAMVISNLFIGLYEFGVMASVYLSILLAVAIGRYAFRDGASLFSIGASSLASAVVFFLITNFAVWYFMDTYAPTMEGLVACYVAGLPYFKYMLAGTAFYAVVLFGGHALLTRALERFGTVESAG